MMYSVSSWWWTACVLMSAGVAMAQSSEVDLQTQLPDARPIPAVQVLPLPYGQASFTHHGRELTRHHFGPTVQRPFWYPLIGPGGRSYTRMGHPRAPHDHRHHDSVWVAHMKVDASTEDAPQDGVSFWEHDNGQRIVCRMVHSYGDGDEAAWMLTENQWMSGDRLVLRELRRCEVRPMGDEQWMMVLDIQLKTPGDRPVTLGQTFFGLVGVRMAKTIGVTDGGGRILNAEGLINEKQVFRKPTRWVDYSGPVAPGDGDEDRLGGITLMDHPGNPAHPAMFHVRRDGWVGVCTTGKGPITIEPGPGRRFRYGLWIHAEAPNVQTLDGVWKRFSELPTAKMDW